MRMVIDVKSREEDESAANGPQWAARGGLFATGTGYLFFTSFLGNCNTTVQVNRLHNDTQAPRAVQLSDHLLYADT